MKKSLLKPYETDASRLKGKAAKVIFPKTIGEVKATVAKNKRIVVRGAGTGFSGGCIPLQGLDVVLDISKLNKISHLDYERKTVEVEAGVVLGDLQRFLRPHRLVFPINIASREIATLGGMIATNASGSRGTKYGKVLNWIQWIDIVDDEGRISRKGATEVSDYCGMEGITGVIVKACLKVLPLRQHSASILEVGSLDEVISITRNLKRDPTVSMIELFCPLTSNWLDLGEGYHLIIEYEDDTGLIKGKEYAALIQRLESVYLEAFTRHFSRVEDPKVLTDRFQKLGEWLDEKHIPFFMHLATGVIHPFFNTDQERHIPEMVKLVRRLGGQVSGSHGIGILKKGFVDPNDKKILVNIKKRTDPLNKFNVGKII